MTESSVILIGDPYGSHSSKSFLQKFTKLISSAVDELKVVSADKPHTGDNVEWTKISLNKQDGLASSLKQFLAYQTKVSKILQSCKRSLDAVVLRSTTYLLPTLVSNFCDLKTYVFVAQKPAVRYFPTIGKLNINLADKLIIESNGVLEHWDIEHLQNKSKVGSVFVDCHKYTKNKTISQREFDVGYLGTLNKRKNVHKLIGAVRKLNSESHNIKFQFGGDGPLREELEQLANSAPNVVYKGFVPETNICKFYNDCKLFILPSSSEGLPNVLLESMACGTPVLATPVSAIQDIIDDGENGLHIDATKINSISKTILDGLDYDLEQLSDNCVADIHDNYTEQSAKVRYKKIFEQ